MNEVDSLNTTVHTILKDSSEQILEIIIILSPKSTTDSVANANLLAARVPQVLTPIVQIRPGLGGAYVDAIEQARGSYLIMMASDLETDPRLVKELILKSRQFPDSIVTATRWRGESAGFDSYGKIKKSLNLLFQKWISKIYHSHLTDYTFGFRLYPKNTLEGINWEHTNFAFLLESILRPIANGCSVVEVSHYWRPRNEGKSSNSPSYFLDYFKVALRVRRTQ